MVDYYGRCWQPVVKMRHGGDGGEFISAAVESAYYRLCGTMVRIRHQKHQKWWECIKRPRQNGFKNASRIKREVCERENATVCNGGWDVRDGGAGGSQRLCKKSRALAKVGKLDNEGTGLQDENG